MRRMRNRCQDLAFAVHFGLLKCCLRDAALLSGEMNMVENSLGACAMSLRDRVNKDSYPSYCRLAALILAREYTA